MDAQTILELKPALTGYLKTFKGCMGRVTNQGHLETYVRGQLSDLERKSVEPIADAAGVPTRTQGSSASPARARIIRLHPGWLGGFDRIAPDAPAQEDGMAKSEWRRTK